MGSEMLVGQVGLRRWDVDRDNQGVEQSQGGRGMIRERSGGLRNEEMKEWAMRRWVKKRTLELVRK